MVDKRIAQADAFPKVSGHRGGAIIVEYALVMAIVVVQLAVLCTPRSDSVVFTLIRQAYQRMVIVISLPWL